jgi:hypothetical protein
MGCETLLKKDNFVVRSILGEEIKFALPNCKDGVVKPTNYIALLGEVSRLFDTDSNTMHLGTSIEKGLDFYLNNSQYFAGELNEQDKLAKKRLLNKTIKGKNELAEVIHRIIAKDSGDTVLNNDELRNNTIFGITHKHINSNIQISSEDMIREIVKGVAVAKKTCDLGDKINRRELVGIFYAASRLLAIPMQFENDHPFVAEWNRDVQVIDDVNLKSMLDPRVIGAMYMLVTAVYLDQENYPTLSKLFSNNFGEEGKPEQTFFGNAEFMTYVYSR